MAEVLLHHPRKHHRGAPPSLYTTDEPPPRIRHTDSTDDSHQRGNKRRDRGGAEEIGPGRKRNRPEHHHHHHHHHHNRRTTPEEGPRFLGHKRKLADIESSDANAASSPDLQELPYNRPIHFVDHRSLFDRLTLFSKSTYKNYTQQIYPTTKHESYADPEHSRAGLDGDERLNGIRMDLLGFADKPIELQMKMHEASLSIEGPMIYREE